MRSIVIAVAYVVLMLSMAACSGVIGGNSQSSQGMRADNPAQAEATSGARAPKVTEPLNPEPFIADACRAISAKQAAGLNLKLPGNGDVTPASSGCIWWTSDRQFTSSLSYMITLTHGLSEIYAQYEKNSKIYKYFEPLTIAGYPALYADKIDERERGQCTLDISVTDNLYMKILATHVPRQQNTCDLAAQAGEVVINTMKNEK